VEFPELDAISIANVAPEDVDVVASRRAAIDP
jgi:hypothetical protein